MEPKEYFLHKLWKLFHKIGEHIAWFDVFYRISTFVGYLMQNPFLYKKSFLFRII